MESLQIGPLFLRPEAKESASQEEQREPSFAPIRGQTGFLATQSTQNDVVLQIEVHKIRPNPAQPRYSFTEQALVSLADSIKQYGILQPLTVRPLPLQDADGAQYELVAGERRLRAAKLLGLEKVPCILRSVDGKRSAELAIIENIQRQDLNMFEEAAAIASLIDLYAFTQEEVAKRLSTSQSYVANKLRILRLCAFEKEIILQNSLTERHARALLRIEHPEDRAQVLRHIVARGYNVAATEEYIDRFLAQQGGKGDKNAKKSRQMKLILKDIRLFYNTINHAIDTVRNAGVNIISSRSENEEAVELTIRIPKQPTPATQDKEEEPLQVIESLQEEPAKAEISLPKEGRSPVEEDAFLPSICLEAPSLSNSEGEQCTFFSEEGAFSVKEEMVLEKEPISPCAEADPTLENRFSLA